MLEKLSEIFLYRAGATEYYKGKFRMDKPMSREEIFKALTGFNWGGSVNYSLIEDSYVNNLYEYRLEVYTD